ncbi:MAG TPA: GAF domain-containing protein, partial [Anaerolineae bacterium]
MTTRTRAFLLLAVALLTLLVFLYLVITAIMPGSFAQTERQIYLLLVLSAALVLPGTAIGILLDKLLVSRRQEQQAGERFQRLVETSPDAIMLADPDGKWSMVNPQAAALFGATSGADLIGRQLQDLMSPEDRARAKLDLARVEAEGAIRQVRLNLHRMDGTPFAAEISIARLGDGSGPAGSMMVVRDVSDRKQIEAVLYEKIAALQIISEMNEAVTSATTLDARLNILLDHLLLQMDGDLAVIQLATPESGSMRLIAQQGARCPEYWQDLKTAESAPGWVVQNSQWLSLPDVRADPRWVPPDASHDEGIVSYYGVPLCVEQRVTGVLSLAMRRSRELLPGDSNFLQSLAGQIAAAIEYARLFQQAQQRASEFSALYETTRDLAYEPDLDTLLRTIVDRAARLLDAKNGAMFLYDTARRDLELAVASDGYPIPLGTQLRIGESMAGRVALTRSPLIVDDYRNWPYRSPRYESIPFTAALQVPMLYGGKLIGVLCVNETEETTR